MESIRKFFFTWFCTSLDRYFYSQLLLNYVLGVMFFSAIVMINELYYIIRLYFEQNVPLYQVLSIFGALIPFLVSFSVPFGVLPAYLLLMGQLSQDSEIVAMRSCGISQFRIMLPGVIFGVFIMIFAYNFKDIVETRANVYYLQLRSKVLSQKPVVQLLDNVFLNVGSTQLSFEEIEPVEGGDDILHNVYAVDVANRQTVRAEEGRIFVSPDNPEHYIMRFLRGDINRLTRETTIITNDDKTIQTNDGEEEFYLSSFGTMTLHNYVWLPSDSYHAGAETFSYEDLKDFIESSPKNISNKAEYQKALSNKTIVDKLLFSVKYLPQILYLQSEDELDREAIDTFLSNHSEGMTIMATDSTARVRQTQISLPNYDTMKLYDKIALPTIALVFAVLSLPLGMFSARSGRGEGLSISLIVVLFFYGFKSVVENAISKNQIPPEYIWLPAMFFGIIAVVLFIRKLNE